MRLASARSRRFALLRPRCARLAALTAPSASLVAAIIDGPPRTAPASTRTAIPDLLTTHIGGAIVKLSFAGCSTQPPPHRPVWSTRNRRPQVTVLSLLSTHTPWLLIRATTRPRIMLSRQTALWPRLQRRIRHPTLAHALDTSGAHVLIFSRESGHAATAIRLSVADALGAALSAAQPQRNEYANRHRRSRWVGVSWPNDEDHDGRDGDGTCGPFRRTRTSRWTRSQTITCVLSCACSRGRPHAKRATRKSSDDLNPFTEVEEP